MTQSGLPCVQIEDLSEVRNRASSLYAVDQPEMVLVPIQISHEDDAGLVVCRRRAENMSRDDEGRLHDLAVPLGVAAVQRKQGCGGGGGDPVESTQQGRA